MLTFEVKYEAGHSYVEKWKVEQDLFCPHCGAKEVWCENGDGDYYEGPNHLCKACGALWTMPSLRINDGKNWQITQRLEAIRKGSAPKEETFIFEGYESDKAVNHTVKAVNQEEAEKKFRAKYPTARITSVKMLRLLETPDYQPTWGGWS